MKSTNIVLHNVQKSLNTQIVKSNLNAIHNVSWIHREDPVFQENISKPLLTPETIKTLISYDNHEILEFLLGFHAINFQYWTPKSPNGFTPYIYQGQSGFYACLSNFSNLFKNVKGKLKSFTQVDLFNHFGDIPLSKERFKCLLETWDSEKLDNVNQIIVNSIKNNQELNLDVALKICKILPNSFEDPFFRKVTYFLWDYISVYNFKNNTNIQQKLPFLADHQTAKILSMHNLIVYNDELKNKIDNGQPIVKDSPEELAIRACIIFTAQQICLRNHISTLELYHTMWHMRTSKQAPFYLCENQRY